jgi:chromosome segregation ATPase
MKNIITFCILSLLITSCSQGLEQYRGNIENLSNKWEEISSGLTTLSEMIQSTKSDWQTNLNNMNLTDEVKARISEDHLAQLDSLKSTYASYGPQVDGMMSQIQAFSRTWSDQKNQLVDLTSALETGKIEGDIQEGITEVQENITAAKEKVDNWKTTFKAVEDELSKISKSRADLLQEAL